MLSNPASPLFRLMVHYRDTVPLEHLKSYVDPTLGQYRCRLGYFDGLVNQLAHQNRLTSKLSQVGMISSKSFWIVKTPFGDWLVDN
ncbi:MAG TPA: hypothetical protein VG944_03785 [Fimbriimonas sp.]|nr:hypothetical protein [Fimbriimonas sp.]